MAEAAAIAAGLKYSEALERMKEAMLALGQAHAERFGAVQERTADLLERLAALRINIDTKGSQA
jgi:hypothetical protein